MSDDEAFEETPPSAEERQIERFWLALHVLGDLLRLAEWLVSLW